MILTVCANPSVDSFWGVDRIEKGKINRSDNEFFFPGGKGVHVAFSLNELNENVTLLGVWGGMTGNYIKNECQRRKIQTIGPEVKGWSRICLTLQSNNDWNDTELLGSGPEVGEKSRSEFYHFYKKFMERKNPEAIIISGSTPKDFKSNVYRKLINESKKFNIPVFIDFTGKKLNLALKSHPYCIHLNMTEGKNITGMKSPMEIAEWLNRYCEISAISAGSEGLYLLFNNKLYHAYHKIPQSKIISTIGAGDCLLAGLCISILNNNNVEYWAKYATACGSANCLNPDLGMLDQEDVLEIFKEVKLEIK